MNTVRSVLCLLSISLWISLSSFNAWAGIDSNAVKATEHVDKIFERMLMAADNGDVDKLTKAVGLLDDLSNEIKTTIGVDLKQHLSRIQDNDNAEKTKLTIQQSVYFSIEYLMDHCFHGIHDQEEVKGRIKNAYKLYLVLDFYIRKDNFETSKQLKQNFRMSNSVAGSNPNQLDKFCQEIKKNLKRLFF